MTKLPFLLASGLLALASCVPASNQGPARSTGLPYGVNDREVETPNSLPPGFTTANPMAPPTGIIGVTRVAP